MANIPNDPVMLLSYINTQLRDFYPDMEELGKALGIDPGTVDEKLAGIDYEYDARKNQYVSKKRLDRSSAGAIELAGI